MKALLRILFFVLIGEGLPFAAFANHVEEVDSVHLIEPISVRHVQGPPRVSAAQTLGGEQLTRLRSESVADAVRFFSGVQIKDYGGVGGLKTVNVRSLGTQQTGISYDGVRLSNAQNGQIDLGRFSMENLESVTLSQGLQDKILHPARDFSSASAIELTTRRPVFSTTRRHNLLLTLKGGSFAVFNPSALWEAQLSPSVSSSISAEYLSSSGRYKFRYRKSDGYDTTAFRRNGDVRALRAEAGLFGVGARGTWRAKLYTYLSERGFPGAVVREIPGKFAHEDRQWDRAVMAQGTAQWRFSTWYTLLANAKWGYDYLRYLSDPRADASTMYVDNHFRQHELYASAAHLFQWSPRWSLSAANDLVFNTLNANLTGFVYPRRTVAYTSLAAAYTSSRWSVQGSLLHTYVHDFVTGGRHNRSRISPTLALGWRVNRNLSLRAYYKHIFRMPTLNDLYYTIVGNSQLNPEQSEQLNAGFSHFAFDGHFEVQVDVYWNRVRDKIVAMPASNQFRWTMLNLGKVDIKGADVGLRGVVPLGEWELRGHAAYTFQRARDITSRNEAWYGGQIPYIPRHSGSLTLGASWRGWSADYNFIYTGERFESRANTAENHAQPWYTSDVILQKTWRSWRFGLELNNLFDQAYEVVQCYPMPGFNIRLKISFTL